MAHPYEETDTDADLFKAGDWDLWIGIPNGGGWKRIETREELQIWLDAANGTLAEFVKRPVAHAMPAALRSELRANGEID